MGAILYQTVSQMWFVSYCQSNHILSCNKINEFCYLIQMQLLADLWSRWPPDSRLVHINLFLSKHPLSHCYLCWEQLRTARGDKEPWVSVLILPFISCVTPDNKIKFTWCGRGGGTGQACREEANCCHGSREQAPRQWVGRTDSLDLGSRSTLPYLFVYPWKRRRKLYRIRICYMHSLNSHSNLVR